MIRLTLEMVDAHGIKRTFTTEDMRPFVPDDPHEIGSEYERLAHVIYDALLAIRPPQSIVPLQVAAEIAFILNETGQAFIPSGTTKQGKSFIRAAESYSEHTSRFYSGLTSFDE